VCAMHGATPCMGSSCQSPFRAHLPRAAEGPFPHTVTGRRDVGALVVVRGLRDDGLTSGPEPRALSARIFIRWSAISLIDQRLVR
jgi:hypothetical protein